MKTRFHSVENRPKIIEETAHEYIFCNAQSGKQKWMESPLPYKRDHRGDVMNKWFYMESHEFFLKTIPDALKTLDIAHAIPTYSPTPVNTTTAMKLKEHLAAFRPDVILITGWTPFQRKPYFDVIREYCQQHQAFLVFWSFEDPTHTDIWGKYIAQAAKPDYIFTHALGCDTIYESLGIPASYLPFAINPHLHYRREPDPKFTSDIALVGRFEPEMMHSTSLRMASLKTLLQPLVARDYDVAIWGSGWKEHFHQLPFPIPEKYLRGPVSYEDIPKIYSSAKINLAIQNEPVLITRRTFECMGSGGFVLTINTPAIRKHFAIDRHVAVSTNRTETLQQVDRYLHNPERRLHIAASGQKEVHDHHTYTTRIKEMIEKIQPYVKAKKENKIIFPPPQKIQKEIFPEVNFSLSKKKKSYINDVDLSAKRSSPGSRSHAADDAGIYLLFKVAEEALYEVTFAQLKLFASIPPSGEPVLNVYAIELPWSVQSLRCGRGPAISKNPVGTIAINKPFQTTYPWNGNWYTLDLTSLVKNWISGKQMNYGLYLDIAPPKDGAVYFTSTRWRGNPYIGHFEYYVRLHPRLEVEYSKMV